MKAEALIKLLQAEADGMEVYVYDMSGGVSDIPAKLEPVRLHRMKGSDLKVPAPCQGSKCHCHELRFANIEWERTWGIVL